MTTPAPEWPQSADWHNEAVPPMDDLRRYFLARGLAASAVSIDLMAITREMEPEHAGRRLAANASTVITCHDVAFLLAELADVDPERAQRAAHRIWVAAEAGDSYGEWLWQWADDAGLDADAIAGEARARLLGGDS